MKKIILFFFSISACFGQIVLDPSFDGDGKVLTPFTSGSTSIYDMALQSDGKIVTVGYSLNSVNYDIVIARYNSDGNIDSSFNLVGFAIIDFGFQDDVGYGIAIQADGKIVVAGSASNSINTDFVLLRYNSDGTLDNGFDSDGIVITTFDVSYEIAYDVAIQPDGKILACGAAYIDIDSAYYFALARYKSDGALDASFGTGGKVTTSLSYSDEAKSMAIQTDGKIVLAGLSKQPDFSIAFGVARYNVNGSLDTSFNSTGKVITSVSPNNDEGRAIAIQTDGKIIVAGKATPVGPEKFALVRYNTDGSLDNTWNGTGMLTTSFGSTWDEARDVVIQSDGKVVAGGLASIPTSRFAMARYNTDGTLDAGFGTAGKLTTSFGPLSSIWALVLQPDSKILAAGYSGTGTDYDFALARYGISTAGGIVDPSILENSVIAYPNPFGNQITLEYCLKNFEMITIQLVDLDGRIKETYLFGELQHSGIHKQDLLMPHDMPSAGTYFIVLSTPNGKVSIKVSRQ